MYDTNLSYQDPGEIRKILLLREHARADAWLRKDRKTLEALLAPDFMEINNLGRFNRNEVLDQLFPSLTIHAFTMEDPHLTITDKETASLSYRCKQVLTVNGKRMEGIFLVSATYRRHGNQYQLSLWEIRPAS